VYALGESPHPATQNLITKSWTLRYTTVKTLNLYLTWACISIGMQWTDGQTDRIMMASMCLALRDVIRNKKARLMQRERATAVHV